jgi:hypothetical protein
MAASGLKNSACFSLVISLAYSLILKMEAIHSSERLVRFYQTAQHHIPTVTSLRTSNTKYSMLVPGSDLLDCDTVQSCRWLPTFWRNILSTSSGLKTSTSETAHYDNLVDHNLNTHNHKNLNVHLFQQYVTL